MEEEHGGGSMEHKPLQWPPLPPQRRADHRRAPAMLGAAGTVLDGPPAGAVASRGGPLREPPAVATAPAGAACLMSALARALDAGGLERLIEWLWYALDSARLAGAVVDLLREAGELPVTLAALDAGELDAGAVVDRVEFGSLSRLRAVADRAMGPH